jgi:hypothetical protein
MKKSRTYGFVSGVAVTIAVAFALLAIAFAWRQDAAAVLYAVLFSSGAIGVALITWDVGGRRE